MALEKVFQTYDLERLGLFPSPSLLSLRPEVPARLCKRLQDAASHESSGGTAQPTSEHSNVARNAYRSIKRWGIAWRVKLDVYNFHCEDGSVLPIHYLHPQKLIEYLVRCHPVVVFGTPDACKARESLLAFWEGYREYHPTHAAFSLGVPMEQLIPVVLHGDEGRGKRRSNTTVFSWESPIGIKGHSSACTACAPAGSWSPECAQGHPFKSLLRSNMKSHSFLQHWPIIFTQCLRLSLSHFCRDSLRLCSTMASLQMEIIIEWWLLGRKVT